MVAVSAAVAVAQGGVRIESELYLLHFCNWRVVNSRIGCPGFNCCATFAPRFK